MRAAHLEPLWAKRHGIVFCFAHRHALLDVAAWATELLVFLLNLVGTGKTLWADPQFFLGGRQVAVAGGDGSGDGIRWQVSGEQLLPPFLCLSLVQ